MTGIIITKLRQDNEKKNGSFYFVEDTCVFIRLFMQTFGNSPFYLRNAWPEHLSGSGYIDGALVLR